MSTVLLLFLTAMAPVETPKGEDAKKELAKLQGVWKLTSRELRGRPMAPSPQLADRYTLVIVGDSYVFMTHAGSFKLDAAKRPAAVDFAVTAGRYNGQKLPGIYELTGNTLRLALPAVTARDTGRPGAMKTDENTIHTIYTFERDAKATKEQVAAALKQRKEAVEAGRLPGMAPAAQPGAFGPANRATVTTNQELLQKILDRLDKIDKRLDEMEKKLPPAKK